MGALFILGLVLSAVIGLSLGLIGGGGSIITVPVLVYAIGVGPHEAIGMSLAVVGSTSLIGAWLHHRRGAVDLRVGSLFGGAGVIGALFGSRLTYLFSPSALMLIFAALMIVIAALMLRKGQGGNEIAKRIEGSVVKSLLAGAAVGGLTGFLGVGGGFLIVPALVLFSGMRLKEAIGTSLFVIVINCAAGLIGHLGHGWFDPGLTLLITGLAVAGALVGVALSHRSSPANLQRWFAGFVIAVAVFIVAKNFQTLVL
jgi:uncharacterized membrane protein YfcA